MAKLFSGKHQPTNLRSQPPKVEIPVLLYHFVAEMSGNELAVAPKAFAEQMEYLAKSGFVTISPLQLIQSLRGNLPVPEKVVVLTFDDGYLDQYTNALPVLLQYRFTAAFFVFLQPIEAGEKDYMSWEQLRNLPLYGMSVESHSLSHQDLSKLALAEQNKEVCLAKGQLERNIGYQVNFFAYPYGKFTGTTVNAVKNCGYIGAFTVGPGKVKPTDELFRLKRQVVTEDLASFKQLVD